VSTVLAVWDALVALGQTTLSGFQVVEGPPDSVSTLGAKVLIVGDGEIVSLNPLAVETASETYEMPLVISVSLPGADMRAPISAALDAYALMESAIRGLSVQGVLRVVPGDWRMQTASDSNGRSAAVKFGVRVYAQI
jgi:hypothetical protein